MLKKTPKSNRMSVLALAAVVGMQWSVNFSDVYAASISNKATITTTKQKNQQSIKVVPGEYVVKFRPGVMKANFFQKSKGITLKKTLNVSMGDLAVIKIDESQKGLLKNLSQDPSIEIIEPNYIYELVGPLETKVLSKAMTQKLSGLSSNEETLTGDPLFNQLWGIQNTGTNLPPRRSGSGDQFDTGVVGADVGAVEAWNITKGSRQLKVAVIDTGIDYNHPDLQANMWTNEAELNGKPGVDDDGNGYIDDIHGYDFANNDADPKDGHMHGTHVAGTIGAVHGNQVGVAGVMAEVSLVAVKFLSDQGSGSLDNAISSIDYATKLNVDIMSNSWGGGGYSELLKNAIQRASDAGIVFTAAAGNSATNNDSTPHYPSNYEVANVISIAAHRADDKLASFSCYGKKTVHLSAPGHGVLSTVPGNEYGFASGTSMATPHATGVIGLLLSQEGRMDHAELKERLMATSIPSKSYKKTISEGRLNAFNVLTNTRPERNTPNPSAWTSVALESIFESVHPYPANLELKRTITVNGAKFIRVIVDELDTEKRYDTLTIKDSSGEVVDQLSGKGTQITTEYAEGNSVEIIFKSDYVVNAWGFLITRVEVIY